MAKNAGFLLSIIVPVYNEEGNIDPLIKRLSPIIGRFNYEIIFVNDGSGDTTEDKIKKYASKNKRIKLISFQRNFGHQAALSAGYSLARGDCVITMDSDLQDPPELIVEMVNKWQKGSKIVYAKRKKRKEGFLKRTSAQFFYRFINSLSDTPIPEDVGDFRLIDKQVVIFLNDLPEKSRFLRGLVSWGGYPSGFVTFTRKERIKGETHYTFSKMLALALDGIISFSTRPLKAAAYFGFIASILGILGIIYAIGRRLFLPPEFWVTGWTALFVAVMFFGGIQLITIGIIGEYIGKIYKEIQGRPMYLIGEKVNI